MNESTASVIAGVFKDIVHEMMSSHSLKGEMNISVVPDITATTTSTYKAIKGRVEIKLDIDYTLDRKDN